ncbi:hypothetical protein MKW98_013608 [Papaver atlanticum]|uniref:Uncharacterized protein n=1 Tax=Papaver atlanticum TaxID=357466 RepID=A0AAD4RYS5_9MAGN|nr:hypothetical protein MKW98_013608 [Papaver atlanticum]
MSLMKLLLRNQFAKMQGEDPAPPGFPCSYHVGILVLVEAWIQDATIHLPAIRRDGTTQDHRPSIVTEPHNSDMPTA